MVFSVMRKSSLWFSALMLLLVTYVGFTFIPREGTNQRVEKEIRDFPDGPTARRVMMVRLPDGRDLPVNYLVEGDIAFIGVDGFWWRQFKGDGKPVRMFIRGESLPGHATVILDRPDYVAEVFKRLRPKVPSWLPSRLNGKLVVIELSKD
jgi:hypothetical protein